MKSKIWPRRPRKWPLDLNDLGMGPVNFFKNYIFKIRGSSWEKWAIARLVIPEKNYWAHSEVVEVKRSFLRSPRPNFGFHLVFTGFHLEFSSFWISRLFDLNDLGVLRMGVVIQRLVIWVIWSIFGVLSTYQQCWCSLQYVQTATDSVPDCIVLYILMIQGHCIAKRRVAKIAWLQ